MKHTWHYPVELLHLYYWWNRSLLWYWNLIKVYLWVKIPMSGQYLYGLLLLGPLWKTGKINRLGHIFQNAFNIIPRSQLKLLTVTRTALCSYSAFKDIIALSYFHTHALFTSKYLFRNQCTWIILQGTLYTVYIYKKFGFFFENQDMYIT